MFENGITDDVRRPEKVGLSGRRFFMNVLKIKKLLAILLIAVVCMPAALLSATHYRSLTLGNGLRVKLYTPAAILEEMTERNVYGRLVLELPNGDCYLLIEDVSDPLIAYKGDGAFHPMNVDWVEKALSEIECGPYPLDMEVEVFILPYPRLCIQGSTSRENMIFLSPGVWEIDRRVVAFITAHELGHAFQYRYLPDEDEEGWYRYLSLRGIYGDPAYDNTSQHVNRPREIFAEDFRYLFGGEDSRYSRTIENPSLPLPDQVAGLEDFMVTLAVGQIVSRDISAPVPGGEIVSVGNYPNPFNPVTTIRAVLGESALHSNASGTLDIYRADGSRVRRFELGRPSGSIVEVAWNGRNDRGMPVSSGVYLYAVRFGRAAATGKMFLIR